MNDKWNISLKPDFNKLPATEAEIALAKEIIASLPTIGRRLCP